MTFPLNGLRGLLLRVRLFLLLLFGWWRSACVADAAGKRVVPIGVRTVGGREAAHTTLSDGDQLDKRLVQWFQRCGLFFCSGSSWNGLKSVTCLDWYCPVWSFRW